MTTKAGAAGILSGLIATLILLRPRVFGSTNWLWIAVTAAALVTIGGGWMAGRWSGSVQPVRCAVLGGLCGGLAGAILFCLLGAGVAGVTAANGQPQAEVIAEIVNRTQWMFLILFLSGIGLGALGGWLAHPRNNGQIDVFDKSEPQMAMNAALTVLPASIITAALTAGVFSHLSASIGINVLAMPLTVSMLLALISHFALTLIIPHEAREAEHRCGMDEVKMAAYVGIGAAPVLATLLFLVDANLLANPRVIIALLASLAMSLKSLQTLFKTILPGRDAFPIPQDDIEAKLFGSIADSHGSRLMALCTGCGLVMVLPLHVTVVSALVNLSSAQNIFLAQALVSSGMAAAAVSLLSVIYLFYLNLGRWFKRQRATG
ncbi:MAG: hypothetical protein HY865_23720 [Chloroflexi bacterium]|nr:hypothetical protein [Chloroflexota bacterium]